MGSKRFGSESLSRIDEYIQETIPKNTKRSQESIWGQFKKFCTERGYSLDAPNSPAALNEILKDFAFNMKKTDGSDYKESVIKTMFNVVVNLLQEMYLRKFNITINPFNDIAFKEARAARDSKRRILQATAEKRRVSSAALTEDEYSRMIDVWDENCPSGLQRKWYQIAARELAFRGQEAAHCMVHYFKEECDHEGKPTGRFEYNPVFSKTCQGGAHRLSDSKWLTPNVLNPTLCPVRYLLPELLVTKLTL